MNRTLLLLSAALLVGGIAVFYVYMEEFRAEEAGGEMVEVLTAAVDIPLGQPVRQDWLTTKDLPQSYVEERHLRSQAARDLIGFPLAQSVRAGEAILRTDLSTLSDARRTLSGSVPQGMRAATLTVTATSTFGGLLRPGDRVDLLLSTGGRELPHTWRGVVVLENLLVLAVGQEFELRDDVSGGADDQQVRFGRASNITLQVTIEQSGILTMARQHSGRMSLVLRNPNDIDVGRDHPDISSPDIFDAARRARFLRRVSVAVPPQPAVAPEAAPGAAPPAGAAPAAPAP